MRDCCTVLLTSTKYFFFKFLNFFNKIGDYVDLANDQALVKYHYLNKAYDALYRSRCLGILEGYGVGPGARRLLSNYCRRLTMADRAGGYYGTAFSGERGVTQGDPLSPTLFNVEVDAVVRHWLDGLRNDNDKREAEG